MIWGKAPSEQPFFYILNPENVSSCNDVGSVCWTESDIWPDWTIPITTKIFSSYLGESDDQAVTVYGLGAGASPLLLVTTLHVDVLLFGQSSVVHNTYAT